jgi:hypothetical protein
MKKKKNHKKFLKQKFNKKHLLIYKKNLKQKILSKKQLKLNQSIRKIQIKKLRLSKRFHLN